MNSVFLVMVNREVKTVNETAWRARVSVQDTLKELWGRNVDWEEVKSGSSWTVRGRHVELEQMEVLQ